MTVNIIMLNWDLTHMTDPASCYAALKTCNQVDRGRISQSNQTWSLAMMPFLRAKGALIFCSKCLCWHVFPQSFCCCVLHYITSDYVLFDREYGEKMHIMCRYNFSPRKHTHVYARV